MQDVHRENNKPLLNDVNNPKEQNKTKKWTTLMNGNIQYKENIRLS